jgi:hypothetical protein
MHIHRLQLADEIPPGLDDLLQPLPESAASPPDVLPGQVREHLHDGGDQRLFVVIRGSVYIPFSQAPHKKVQRIQVRSNRTQEWCAQNLPFFWEKEVWPPSSPDLNPLDFLVWGVTERDVNRSPHNTKQSLITSIMKVFADLSREDVRRACSRFRSRLEEVVEARGDFIC